MPADKETSGDFELFIEDLPYELPVIESAVSDCTNSDFSVAMADGSAAIPDAFNIFTDIVNRQVSITIVATSNLEISLQQSNEITYALQVLETDINTKFVSNNIYNVRIKKEDEAL